MSFRLVALAFILLASLGASTPMVGIDGSCVSGDYLRWNGSSIVCTSPISSGQITFVISGSCPTGWTEVSALNGVMLRGTLAANGNVGTTGGSDSYTPAGSVAAPSFTGSPATLTGSVAAPTFTGSSATTSAVTGGTPSGTISTPTFTGNAVTAASTTSGTKLVTSNTSTGVSPITTATGTISTPTFTGSALATHTHTLTAAGTNNAPALTMNSYTPQGTNSAPAFTGQSATVIPAFVRVIFCQRS